MKVSCPLCKGPATRLTGVVGVSRRYRCDHCGAELQISGTMIFGLYTVLVALVLAGLIWFAEYLEQLPSYTQYVVFAGLFPLHEVLVARFLSPEVVLERPATAKKPIESEYGHGTGPGKRARSLSREEMVLVELGALVAVLAALDWFGITLDTVSWYVFGGVFIALIPVWAFGTFLLKTQPAVPALVAVSPSDPTVPQAARGNVDSVLRKLTNSGLQPVEPWVSDGDEMLYVILQHAQSSDVLIVQTNGRVQLLQFLRQRADGSRLETSRIAGGTQWPRNPRDNALSLVGGTNPLPIWKGHQVRVKRDPLAGRNPRVTDPVAFQREVEHRENAYLIRAGYRSDAGGGNVRASLTGALVMAARTATPWALVLWLRGRLALSRLTRSRDSARAYETFE